MSENDNKYSYDNLTKVAKQIKYKNYEPLENVFLEKIGNPALLTEINKLMIKEAIKKAEPYKVDVKKDPRFFIKNSINNDLICLRRKGIVHSYRRREIQKIKNYDSICLDIFSKINIGELLSNALPINESIKDDKRHKIFLNCIQQEDKLFPVIIITENENLIQTINLLHSISVKEKGAVATKGSILIRATPTLIIPYFLNIMHNNVFGAFDISVYKHYNKSKPINASDYGHYTIDYLNNKQEVIDWNKEKELIKKINNNTKDIETNDRADTNDEEKGK
jgi:hypothetical protein